MAHSIEIVRVAKPMRYRDAYRAQTFRRDAVISGRMNGAIFVLEHLPVITMGRNGRQEHLLRDRAELRAMGIELHEADRGGDVTYHGPGQLVAYPVLDLKRFSLTIKGYMRLLEQAVIDLLADYGLKGDRVQGLTGVWVNGAKVAAIGVGARRWVTYHGLALNVDPDMSHFGLIVPCGIADRPVTSLKLLREKAPSMDDVADKLVAHLLAVFSDPSPVSRSDAEEQV